MDEFNQIHEHYIQEAKEKGTGGEKVRKVTYELPEIRDPNLAFYSITIQGCEEDRCRILNRSSSGGERAEFCEFQPSTCHPDSSPAVRRVVAAPAIMPGTAHRPLEPAFPQKRKEPFSSTRPRSNPPIER